MPLCKVDSPLLIERNSSQNLKAEHRRLASERILHSRSAPVLRNLFESFNPISLGPIYSVNVP